MVIIRSAEWLRLSWAATAGIVGGPPESWLMEFLDRARKVRWEGEMDDDKGMVKEFEAVRSCLDIILKSF